MMTNLGFKTCLCLSSNILLRGETKSWSVGMRSATKSETGRARSARIINISFSMSTLNTCFSKNDPSKITQPKNCPPIQCHTSSSIHPSTEDAAVTRSVYNIVLLDFSAPPRKDQAMRPGKRARAKATWGWSTSTLAIWERISAPDGIHMAIDIYSTDLFTGRFVGSPL